MRRDSEPIKAVDAAPEWAPCLVGIAVLLVALADVPFARAADLPLPDAPAVQPALSGFEARLGLFDHGIGSAERNTVDLSGEFVIAKPFMGSAYWTYLIPRPHLGSSVNLDGRTSFVYGGGLWTFPIYGGFFVEGYFDAALHDGLLQGDATHSALGCNPLFHTGGSAGYHFNDHWSLIFTFEHLSNGEKAFGVDCSPNQGLNNYGLRLGYTF